MRFLFCCLFFLFTVTTFAQQSYSCPSCAGSGSTYQTRKVPSFTTETYEAYGSLPGMVRKVSSYTYYQEEGGYSACLRCGGSGRLTYSKHPTTITPRKKTKKAEYSKAHYIMKVYNKKFDYKKNKIVQLDIPGGNIHLVTYYKSGERKRDLVESKGKTYNVIVEDDNFSNYDIVYDENQKFQFLKVDNDRNTTIYDANGRKIKQFSGRMYSAKNNLIWVENKDLRDAYYKNIMQKGYYQLVDYKTNKAIIDGNYKINLSLKCTNLFNKKGIIDVKKVDPFTGEVKLGFVNRKGETVIPFQHASVFDCEQSENYIDVISTHGELLSYDVKGNLLSPSKGKLTDCGKGVKCYEYKVATQTQTQEAPEKLIRLVAPNFPAINGRQFTEFHGFNEKGWAKAKNQHSDYYLIHTSGFIAFDDNSIAYENFTTPKIAITTLSSEREKTGKTDYFAEKKLENFEKVEKKGKIGAKYTFSYFINKTHEKKFKIPTNYKSVRPLDKNTIAVENFNGKWGLYVLNEKKMYEVAPQFDELLCSSTLITYGKKRGKWYKITAFFESIILDLGWWWFIIFQKYCIEICLPKYGKD